MSTEEIYGTILDVDLHPRVNRLSSITLILSAGGHSDIEITEKGSIDDLQKKYDFNITGKNKDIYETGFMVGMTCKLSKDGDKYSFIELM